MLDETKMMPFNFLSYGGVITGELKGMRYRLKRTGEKPDFVLTASVWHGPYGYDATAESEIISETFPYSKEGRLSAIEWMKEKYRENEDRFSVVRSILDVEPVKK